MEPTPRPGRLPSGRSNHSKQRLSLPARDDRVILRSTGKDQLLGRHHLRRLLPQPGRDWCDMGQSIRSFRTQAGDHVWDDLYHAEQSPLRILAESRMGHRRSLLSGS